MKKGLAVFSGSAVVHKLMQDGTVVLGTAANPAVVTISGTLDVKDTITVAADKLSIGANHPYTQTNLSGVLAEIKTSVTNVSNAAGNSNSALEQVIFGAGGSGSYTAANSLSGAIASEVARLDGRLDTLIGSGSIASTLDTIKEIADFLDNSGSAAVDLTTRVADVSSSLANYKVSNDAALIAAAATASADLAAANFSVNGQAISASGGAFVITGSSNITVSSMVAGTASVSLNNDVTLTGKLDAAVVSASAGLSVAGGAAIAGGLTVSSGITSVGVLSASATELASLAVVGAASVGGKLSANGGLDVLGAISGSGALQIGGASTLAGAVTAQSGLTVSSSDLVVAHGTMKAVLESAVAADATRLAELSDSTNLAAGQFDGMSFYLKGAASGAFARANCWYFCQDGAWFDAPFFAGE
jgi:hypothetical protein